MKKWKNILLIGLGLVYFPVIFSFVSIDQKGVVCGEILPVIRDSVDNQFIGRDDVVDITLEKYPGILGRKASEINCEDVELFFGKHPAVERCEVYLTGGGALHIDVYQRGAMVRVFDGEASYYLDTKGVRMPLFKHYAAHTLVANGYISKLPKEDLVSISRKIVDDEFWKAQIEQIYVTRDSEIVLVPRVGDHLIEFGHLEGMDEKFRNLKALYKSGWDSREWNMYKKVSLKYKGQVVCTKA